MEKKVLVIPEGVDGFERDKMRQVAGVKKEYVKEIQ